MNITLNKTDAVSAAITIEIGKADYADKVENSLKDLRRNAVIPGFRKGMVPSSLLRQKYGKSIFVEEINKLVSESLTNYIKENTPDILGEPLPAEGHAPADFDTQEDFEFTFDIGLSPQLDVQLTKDDKLPYYLIQISEELIDKQIESYQSKFGSHESAEEVDGNDLVKGLLIELSENGEPKEGGISQENAVLMPVYIKNEEEKAKFIQAKNHSTVVFNPAKAYEGNEAEIASFLNIQKEDAANYTGDFSFEIKEISRYKSAELNQELFDKVFETGTIDSEEAFREKVKEILAQQLAPESDYKLFLDTWKLLEEKTSDLQFPDAFLKRWLLYSDSKRTPESLEEEYPGIVKSLKYHLIREHLIEINDIKIDESDIHENAKRAVRNQFAQYGIDTVSDEFLEKYATEMVQKQETYRSLGDRAFEDKLMQLMKEQVTLETQEISLEDFKKLFEQ
jgi:trigger factor